MLTFPIQIHKCIPFIQKSRIIHASFKIRPYLTFNSRLIKSSQKNICKTQLQTYSSTSSNNLNIQDSLIQENRNTFYYVEEMFEKKEAFKRDVQLYDTSLLSPDQRNVVDIMMQGHNLYFSGEI